MKIAIAMAKTRVARSILNLLEESALPEHEVVALDFSDSVGYQISTTGGKIISVQSVEEYDFAGTDIAFFVSDDAISEMHAKRASHADCMVISDNASFLESHNASLVVPEVNAHLIASDAQFFISPDAMTTQIVTVMKSLHDVAKIKRIVASTYHAVSDLGKDGMDELHTQTKAIYTGMSMSQKLFHKRVAFNCIPQVGEFTENGYTDRERTIRTEIQDLLGEEIKVTVSCVYAPVFIGHSAMINIEFENKMNAQDVLYTLSKSVGVAVANRMQDGGYVTPVESVGEYPVYVSRVRDDEDLKNCVNMWVVSDNLCKGTGFNMVQIAELWHNARSLLPSDL